MNILITSARAPVALEWVKIAQACGHQAWLSDSLTCPIARYARGVRYHKVPPPRLDFMGYQQAMMVLIRQADVVIPTCEDIFYLVKLPLSDGERAKCHMPTAQLLYGLHHKSQVYGWLPNIDGIKMPDTALISKPDDIIDDGVSGVKTVLKPVYSRFGRSVVRGVSHASIAGLPISPRYPWVQQRYITGQAVCNYAIYEHGRLIAHAAYIPKYLLNGAAGSYFEPMSDERLDAFMVAFGVQTGYHGQVAFDFIDDGDALWVLECNPRATSGVHLLGASLTIDDGGRIGFSGVRSHHPLRVGVSLPIMFGWDALRQGRLNALIDDHRRADDVLATLPAYASAFALAEMCYRTVRYVKPFTSASTFDIEYDGEPV